MSLTHHLSRHSRRLLDELAEFGLIGLIGTAVYLALYELLRPTASALGANAVALVLTAIGSTLANRRFTFRAQGHGRLGQEAQEVMVVLLLGLAISSAALGLLGVLSPTADTTAQMMAMVGANTVAAVLRFLVLRASLGEG